MQFVLLSPVATNTLEAKMQIRMTETRRGSEDGFSTRQFIEGQECDVTDSLAREFIHAGYAECINPQTLDQVVQEIIASNRKAITSTMEVPNGQH